MWNKRQQGGYKIIGGLRAVSIQDGERYCLRKLLLHRPGAMKFNDLKTVNGIQYETLHLPWKKSWFP